MKLIVLSQGGKKPALFQSDRRIEAVQAMETRVRVNGNVADPRGNPAIRNFIEAGTESLAWGDCRLDILEVA